MRHLVWILAVATAGCGLGQSESGLGALEPQMAATGGEFATDPTRSESEINPSRRLEPGDRVAVPRREGDEPERPAAKSEHEEQYEARLQDVPLPVPPAGTPLVAGEENGQVLLADTILAEVNDEVITREDIFGPLRAQIRQWRQDLPAEEFEARCRTVVDLKLREVISERLVIQEAKRRLSEAQKEQLEATLGQILKDLAAEAGSMLLLEERLKAEGSTVEQQMERERERILVQQFLRERIAPTVHITHSELLAYYAKVRDERYVEPTRIRLRLIQISKSEFPDAAQARALAEAVHARARGGEDFAKLAQRYSHDAMAEKGGDWGYVTEGSFRVREVDDVLFALGTGEVGPIVETGEAFYLIKADDRREGRTVPFTEVQNDLEREISDARYNEMVSRYIQDLYRKSYVRIRPENL